MCEPIVLIADDDADLVALLARRCRGLGLGVETAGDGLTALNKIEQRRPDLVILDVNMPGGNGLSVREMMVDNERVSSIPVIILTGRMDEETMRRCYNSCAYYVPKCTDVWPRLEPLLRELLELDQDSSQAADRMQTSGGKANPYEESDQKVFFDWIFDMLAEEESPPDQPADNELPPHGDAVPWVLCIDDDREFSLGLQLRLQEQGVEVLRACTGMEGYRHAMISSPMAIILDYEMPNGNGDYVLRRLKETPATRDVPVIVVTGHADHALERKMYAMGADAFLAKPCPWDKLQPVLLRYLQRARSPAHA